MNLVGAFLAAVQLASPFADHMVLQRDKPVPVCGGGAPGESVAVAFAGSVQTPGEWHDKARRYYYPQWTLPDGTKAGMVWCVGNGMRRPIRFSGGKPVFRNLYGRRISVLELEDNVFNIPISESPVYFEGAEGIFAEQGGVK